MLDARKEIRLLGVQFGKPYLQTGLYEEMGKHAVDQAMRIQEAFKDKGYRFLVDSPSNQQFLFLPRDAKDKLSKDYAFECEGDVGQEEVA